MWLLVSSFLHFQTLWFQIIAKVSHFSLPLDPSVDNYPQSRRCSSRRCRKSPKPIKDSQWRMRSCCGNCTMAFHLETLHPFPAPLFHRDDLRPWTSIDFWSFMRVTSHAWNLTCLFPEMADALVRTCVWDRADVAQMHFWTEEHALLCHLASFSLLFLFYSFVKRRKHTSGFVYRLFFLLFSITEFCISLLFTVGRQYSWVERMKLKYAWNVTAT